MTLGLSFTSTGEGNYLLPPPSDSQLGPPDLEAVPLHGTEIFGLPLTHPALFWSKFGIPCALQQGVPPLCAPLPTPFHSRLLLRLARDPRWLPIGLGSYFLPFLPTPIPLFAFFTATEAWAPAALEE